MHPREQEIRRTNSNHSDEGRESNTCRSSSVRFRLERSNRVVDSDVNELLNLELGVRDGFGSVVGLLSGGRCVFGGLAGGFEGVFDGLLDVESGGGESAGFGFGISDEDLEEGGVKLGSRG